MGRYPEKHIYLAASGLFFLTCLLYAQTLFFDFVWDDLWTIVRNQKVRSIGAAFSTFYQPAAQKSVADGVKLPETDDIGELSAAPLYKSETKFEPMRLTSGNWRPLRTVCHATIYHLFKLDTFYYHLANVIAAGLVVVLLFILLLRLTGSFLAALSGALLFAVHPLASEVVCWVKELEDMLATIFLLLSFNLILVARQRRKIGYLLAAGLLYPIALTAKLSVVFFPLFLLIFLFYEQNKNELSRPAQLFDRIKSFWGERGNRATLLAACVLLLEALGAVVWRSHVLGHTAHGGYITGSCWTTWLSMPRVFCRYLYLQLIPYPLYADYFGYPTAASLTDAPAWGFVLLFLALLAGGTWLFAKQRLLMPWLWFWLAVAPFSNLVAMNTIAAERFLYIPLLGTVWLVAELVKRYQQRSDFNLRSFLALLTTVVIIMAVMTMRRSQDWSCNLSIYRSVANKFPESYRPNLNLAISYLMEDQNQAALRVAAKVAKRYPTVKSISIFAQALCYNGNFQMGIPLLIKVGNNVMLNRIGIYAAQHGWLNEAERCFLAARQIAPHNPRYRRNLRLLRQQRDYMTRHGIKPQPFPVWNPRLLMDSSH